MKKLTRNGLFIVLLLLFLAGGKPEIYSQTANVNMDQRIENLLSQMTLEEKISLCHANTKFSVAGIDRLGIPSLSLSDGPHGIREEIMPHSWDPAGWTSDSSTYLPTGTALAATWNPEIAEKFGTVLGEEARARGKDILLGPAINIQRTPLCGRNFEYLSEDPFLIASMVVPYIRGVQEQDVAACVKHYILNNQDYERFTINVEVGDRALREIYMPGFRAAVQQGEVLSVMCSYNKFRGDYLCSNKYLLTDILKEEWGFPGVVLSDWDATHSTIPSAIAGLDLEMGTDVPDYNEYFFAEPLLEAVKNDQLDEKVVDEKVRRILKLMFRINMFSERTSGSFNTPEHQQFARKTAEEAVVLLKNENNLLPLDINRIQSVAVIGDNAARKHAHGGYSSGIKAVYEVTPLEGLQNKLKDKVKINFAQGYEKSSQEIFGKGVVYTPNPQRAAKLIEEAVAVAEKSDAAIIFGGLNHDFDTEGLDRTDMKLPYTQNELIQAVHKANPNTIVVLISGSPVEIYEWVDIVPSILQGWYAGMEGGNAFADILFGDVNPSGKLPFTMPVKLEDSPAHALGEYPGGNGTVTYNEGIFVGYRYFLTRNIRPQFCFGHGLSYTDFEYSDLKLKDKAGEGDLPLEVSLKVSNTGTRAGMEVVQLYLGDKMASVERPDRELKGFRKVQLEPGQSKEINFLLDRDAFSFYDPESASWKAEPGLFTILAGSSSQDIRLKQDFDYTGR